MVRRNAGAQIKFRVPEERHALSSREFAVTRLVAQGLTNREVAARLSISDQTVKNHLTVIYVRAGVANRVELTIWALRNGIANLDSA